MYFSVLGMALPSFFSAILIAWVFVYLLNAYTGLFMTWSFYEIDDYGISRTIQFKNVILPALTLGIRPLTVIIQLCRSSLLDVLSMDYVRTAKAKGLNKFVVVFKHALRGGLIPVVAFLGPAFAGLLSGSFVVETIFQIPGLGRFYVQAAFNRDYTMILGTTIFFSTLIIMFNLLSDIVSVWLDPKLRDQYRHNK